jgi:hypothetical protein
MSRHRGLRTFPGSALDEVQVRLDDPLILLFRYTDGAAMFTRRLKRIVRSDIPDLLPEQDTELFNDCADAITTHDEVRKFILAGNYTIGKTEHCGELLMKVMDQKEVSTYLDIAWSLLTDDQKAELCQRFYTVMIKSLNAGLEPRTRETILQYAMTLAEEELERRTEEIRAKVVEEIEARWSKVVEAVVTAKLADALAEVKARVVRP